MTKNLIFCFLIALSFFTCKPASEQGSSVKSNFIRIDGQNLIAPNGGKFFIQGINLGNWLNPEGYMFSFQRTSSARLIDKTFCELVGPDFTNLFWKQFKDNYITRDDIRYIRKTGMNTIRIPFHYKLFTDVYGRNRREYRPVDWRLDQPHGTQQHWLDLLAI